MGKITVYRYMTLDTNIIAQRVSSRWGTREAIENLKLADIIESSALQVDEAVLNESGFTPMGFEPAK
jgi:hypothetical protein